tara:strand:+ start:466 stop:975 length:510 start_codon:yes stop_codon:yes gene_type:complete
MISLDRQTLTNVLNANKNSFESFDSSKNYCSSLNQPESCYLFVKLLKSIESEPLFKQKIEETLKSPFKIDYQTVEIKNGLELVDIIRRFKLEISEGEETWIKNLERVRDTLKNGACCATRAALNEEGRFCYEDLVNQCDSNWVFVKELKSCLEASSIIFHYSNDTQKQV